MERLLCIDFGSSYTKVAVREDWNGATRLIETGHPEESYSFCIPSTVARVTRRGKDAWLIGMDALSQSPGHNVAVYQNWKSDLFSGKKMASEYGTVGANFFRELVAYVGRIEPQLQGLPVRVCIPKFGPGSDCQLRILKILGDADIAAAPNRSCIFEPEANIFAVLTRGRNAAWRRSKTHGWEPSYQLMFEKDQGGLFDKLRAIAIAKRPGNLKYALLLIDIGSFTSDFGLVQFEVDAGDIEDFNKPDVIQESNRIGIRELDHAVLKVFSKAVRDVIASSPPKIWEDAKRQLYSGTESAVENPVGGMFVLGSKKERPAIDEQVDAFAEQVVVACRDFCRKHRVKPVRTVITGGGAMISRLRMQIVAGLARTIPAEVYDLMDPDEPRKSLLQKKTKEGPWRHDEREVEARLRENRRIVRGGSSIGGCSNFVDLPVGS